MASSTLLALIQECGSATRWRLVDNPSATGTTTTFVFGSADSPVDEIDTDTLYKNSWAYVEADSAGTPLNVGECRRVKSFTPSTATFTLATSRGFSNAPTTTQTIGVYRTVPPDAGGGVGERETWKSLINRTLRNIRYRRYSLLTLISDGDMESSATTSWTASNSTLTKSTTAANVALGARSLSVQNTAANGYARSTVVEVAEGDVYTVAAQLNVSSGTAYLVAYDETNSTEIESENTDLRDWRQLDFYFTIPADCHSISIRLKASGASDLVYWDNVSLRPAYAQRMDLPSWVANPNQVEGLVEWYGDSVQGDGYMVASQLERTLRTCRVLSDPTGATGWRAEYHFRPTDRALLFVRGLSPYDELSALTDTTTCDKYTVVFGACLLAGQKLGDETLINEFGPKWKARADVLPRRITSLPEVR